jgi:phosphoribosylaminoimidazole (AIR) synthetase
VLGLVKGLAHITGGGLPGKMPAILPAGVTARFRANSWPVPPIFDVIRREGRVEEAEMRRVFNLGLGMVAVCAPDQVNGIRQALPEAMLVGEIISRQGTEQVIFE